MTPCLLDVNVLVALVREDHISHAMVRRWFQRTGGRGWATCALTQAGFVRVVSNPKFAEPALAVAEALEMLGILTKSPDHQFWPMNVEFQDAVEAFAERLFGHQQITDAYLLGMAIAKKGRLVTLDGAIKALAGSEFARHVEILV